MCGDGRCAPRRKETCRKGRGDKPYPTDRTGRPGRPSARSYLCLYFLVSACTGHSAATDPGGGGGDGGSTLSIQKISGDSQTATIGTALANPVEVRVLDASGHPDSGVVVKWQPGPGSGSAAASSSTTNAQGQASTQWTVDTTFIGNTLTAVVGSQMVSFWALGNGSGSLGGRQFFPADNAWNADISGQPVDPNSSTLIASCGATSPLHPDFGTVYAGAPNGIPYVVVHGTQSRVPVTFTYADESDPGPYPVPPFAPIEGGASGTGDRHVLTVDLDHWQLYEMFDATPLDNGASWTAGSGARFNLDSDSLRPAGWTSADAAGLPILPGLVRYDEVVLRGAIKHALRFTCPTTRHGYVAPARHFASSDTSSSLPPMGMRVRLKATVDISGFPTHVQVILRALQTYGMFVADNGSPFFVSGAPDPRWSDSELHTMTQLQGSDFEVVKMGTVTTN
jgi:hypothetical protein